MFYVYVLQSKRDAKLYVGYTNDLKKRVNEHSAGMVESTSPRRPFKLVYYEAYLSRDDARRREYNLKLRGQARTQLQRRIETSIRQSKS
jgi:putative endonuclease